MAKEHEKIPKVKNAPRKIRSQSSVGTWFAPLLELVLVARGSKSSVISKGKGQSSVLRRCFGLPQHKGSACTAHLQGEWEGSSGKLDIDNFQKPPLTETSQTKVPSLAQEHGSKRIHFQTWYLRRFYWSDVSPSLARAIVSKSCSVWINENLELFPLSIIVEGERQEAEFAEFSSISWGKARSRVCRVLIHLHGCSASPDSPQEGEQGNLGTLPGKGSWGQSWHGASSTSSSPHWDFVVFNQGEKLVLALLPRFP